MKLETRLLIALGVMSLLVVAVALSGRMGLAHAKDTTQEILLKDAHLAEEALEARSFTLQLRRYEKDYFLNIGAPAVQAEYLVKWKDAHEALVARLEISTRSSQAPRTTTRCGGCKPTSRRTQPASRKWRHRSGAES